MLWNIEVAREKSGMSKKELSNFLGISLKTYYNWLNGKNPIPHTALVKMKEKFNVSIEFLVEETKNAVITEKGEKPQNKVASDKKRSINKMMEELIFYQNT
mgnify:CR=1 FL=1